MTDRFIIDAETTDDFLDAPDLRYEPDGKPLTQPVPSCSPLMRPSGDTKTPPIAGLSIGAPRFELGTSSPPD